MIRKLVEILEEDCSYENIGKTFLFKKVQEVSNDSWINQQNESILRYQSGSYEEDGTIGTLFGCFISQNINRSGITLDIGCGIHSKLPHYVKNLNLSFFIGIEPIPMVIDREFYCLAGVLAESLPIKNNVVDSAIFATSLDHIANASKAINEVLRTMKTDGKLFFWLGVHDPFILAEAKTYGVVHNHSKGLYKWARILLSPIEHLLFHYSMIKRKNNLLNGKRLDKAHVRYHTVLGIENEFSSYGLEIVQSILVPGSASLFLEAKKNFFKH
jgi:SAM-dependent methyltransferase